MKKIYFLLISFSFCFSTAQTQHYLTPGVGYSLAFFDSDDLELFKDSYNFINKPRGLLTQFHGLKQPVGIRFEMGYFHFGKLSTHAHIGFQNYVTKDFAEFDNHENRELILKLRSFFIEGGIGPRFGKFFINGITTIYFHRKISLESIFNGPEDPQGVSPLDGEFQSTSSISTDFGIAVGINKDPIVLTLKITYPLFTGGSNDVLTDDNLAKVKAGTSLFPANFQTALLSLNPESELYGKPYDGIRSNIDGLKIIITLGVPLLIKE